MVGSESHMFSGSLFINRNVFQGGRKDGEETLKATSHDEWLKELGMFDQEKEGFGGLDCLFRCWKGERVRLLLCGFRGKNWNQ